jgi:hypothetical protein
MAHDAIMSIRTFSLEIMFVIRRIEEHLSQRTAPLEGIAPWILHYIALPTGEALITAHSARAGSWLGDPFRANGNKSGIFFFPS